MECNHPDVKTAWINEILVKVKTGDLILFKATDNINSSKIFCYYTHIGIVWLPPVEEGGSLSPQIFEATGTHDTDLYSYENSSGIFLTDLKTRLTRYKGKLYYKPLNKSVIGEYESAFHNFITYAKANIINRRDVIPQ